jgi:hypothetical protein
VVLIGVLAADVLVVLVVLVVVLVVLVVVVLAAGRSDASPGLVKARISSRLVNPSPSESSPSMPLKLNPLDLTADPYGLRVGTLVWHVEQLASAVPAVAG